MPTIEVKGKDLLEVVKQLPPKEFDAFINGALSLRAQPKASTLLRKETKRIKQIGHGLPVDLCKRQAELAGRLKKGTLTPAEHQELLEITHVKESRDAERAAAPVQVLMRQMGNQAPPIHV